MKKILLYHIFPINNWKEITDYLFQQLPFDKIIVHVSLPNDDGRLKLDLEEFFNKYKVDEFLYTPNSGIGEVDALKKFAKSQKIDNFDILTYMHCKGVTKPDNVNIFNWTKLMRYFIIHKMDLCEKVFEDGYVTFGINKSIPAKNDKGFINSNFFYEGNFVSLNLKKVDLFKSIDSLLEDSYYGAEGFWGKLCNYNLAYTAFDSGVNHYMMSVPEKSYSTMIGRAKYALVKKFYQLKSKLI